MTLSPFETTYTAGRRTIRGTRFHSTIEEARGWFDREAGQLAIDHGVKVVRFVSVTPVADHRACICGADHDCRSTGCDEDCGACS